MSTPKFAKTHNLVVFLEKPKERNRFEEIIDFLNASSVQYALTVNPTIYTTCIEQFWTPAKVKTVNGERQIQVCDKKKVIISETSIRSDLKLDDAEGTYCLPTATIFAELERMGVRISAYRALLSERNSEEHVSTPSYDPPPSGEDRMQLAELMSLCTNLQEKVLDLEKAKTAQAKEITSLKKRVKQLEKRRKVKDLRAKKEDASKQGRKIEDLDADAEVTLVNETQEMNDDNLMFDTGVLEEQEIKFEKVVEEPVVKGPPIFDDDQYEEESMPVYDTDIEDVIGGEEGFIEKGGFGRKEDNIEDVVSQLKSKSYDEIQKLFDKEMKRVNTFVDMNSEVVKGSETRTEESSKRAGDELESDMSKKQKIDEHVEVEKDDQEEAEMKRHIKIVKDDEVAIDAYLATKAPSSDCLEYPE
ncbi:hypothetical protein Tco_0815547 [Tanacetum coccineum]